MYPRTRNARDNWNAVTDPTPSALAGSMLVLGLGPIVGSYLTGHLTVSSGLLIGIGVSYLVVRLSRLEADTNGRDDTDQPGELPMWFSPREESRPITAETTAD